MTANDTRQPSVLDALVDDAGLFPPTQLSMSDAVARHARDSVDRSPVLTDRFLCPATRLAELVETAADSAEPQRIPVVVVVDCGVDQLAAVVGAVVGGRRAGSTGVEVVGLEMRLPAADSVEAGVAAAAAARDSVDPSLPLVVEIPLASGDWWTPLSALAESGIPAKVRCGGASAELFPHTRRVAELVVAASDLAHPFKATAGLHHAVRYVDGQTGLQHHGFLNLLVAVLRATSGGALTAEARLNRVEAALLEEDAELLADEVRSASTESARVARQVFLGYGSCSTSAPVEDLGALGLLDPDEPPSPH